MTTISIRNNFPQVVDALDRLQRDLGHKVVVRALNTTVEQAKTQMARGISGEFRISVADVKKRLKVHRAYVKAGRLHFQAVLEASGKNKGRSMNLIHFVENKTTLAEAKRRRKEETLNQVHFQIKRAGGKKVIKGAFIANGGRTVFIREGKARLPIKALGTIDVPQMFNTKRINSVVRKAIEEKFLGNFKREWRAAKLGYLK